jgi:hypothetical protein
MEKANQVTAKAHRLAHMKFLVTLIRGLSSRFGSLRLPGRIRRKSELPPTASALKIARYGLVLMDHDGQVVWTGEWDSGGVFEFRPRQRLLICCAFTNHSGCETEVSEYEIELVGEDGSIVERFNDSFGDLLVISPGERKQFPAEWQM